MLCYPDTQEVPRREAGPRLPSHGDRCSRLTGGCSCVCLCQGGCAAGRPAGQASHVSNMISHSETEGKRARRYLWSSTRRGAGGRYRGGQCQEPLWFRLSPSFAGLASFFRISSAGCPSQDPIRKPCLKVSF